MHKRSLNNKTQMKEKRTDLKKENSLPRESVLIRIKCLTGVCMEIIQSYSSFYSNYFFYTHCLLLIFHFDWMPSVKHFELLCC